VAGTKEGGLKAAATNKAKYGDSFYKRVGAIGGKIGNTGGFASEFLDKDGLTGRERASKVGQIGGTISRRWK